MTSPHQVLVFRIAAISSFMLLATSATGRASALYTLTDLGPAVGTNLDVFNSSGQITTLPTREAVRPQDGVYSISSSPISSVQTAGFLEAADQPTTVLDAPVGDPRLQQVWASAVNKSGMVVGTETYNTVDLLGVAFMYSKSGGMQAVPTPYSGPSSQSTASSINDAGMIVGTVTGPSGTSPPDRAFLSDGHSSWDLNTLIAPGSGWLLTSALDINDLGQIVGQGVNAQGQGRDYLLTPTTVPEPRSFLVVGTGMLCLRAFKMVRRKHETEKGVRD
jgi:Protein of unknown function (DUF3466)